MQSFDEVVELIAKHTGASVPKRQVEELAVRAACDFDEYYRNRLRTAEDTEHLLILSFDGKGVAMLHRDLREATRKAAEATPRRLETRLVKGEKPNHKRMAEVATVYTLEQWPRTLADVLHGLSDKHEKKARRPRPTNKRVWASIVHSPQQVIDDAFAEAARRDPEHRRRWVVLVDGNRDQLRLIKRAARKLGVKITIVLDIVHVLEYLWHAAYAFHAEGTDEAEKWVEHQFVKLLGGHSGGAIAKSLRLMIKGHGLDATTAKPVEKAAGYLVKNTRYLHYDRALAEGLPIATGVIEGACRYLVKDRMGRTGAIWSMLGAEAVLRLRALRASDDFDDYWLFHVAKERERPHLTLRRWRSSQPAAAQAAAAPAGQVIGTALVEPCPERAAPKPLRLARADDLEGEVHETEHANPLVTQVRRWRERHLSLVEREILLGREKDLFKLRAARHGDPMLQKQRLELIDLAVGLREGQLPPAREEWGLFHHGQV